MEQEKRGGEKIKKVCLQRFSFFPVEGSLNIFSLLNKTTMTHALNILTGTSTLMDVDNSVIKFFKGKYT